MRMATWVVGSHTVLLVVDSELVLSEFVSTIRLQSLTYFSHIFSMYSYLG